MGNFVYREFERTIEAIYLSDLPAFVVSSEEGDPVRVSEHSMSARAFGADFFRTLP